MKKYRVRWANGILNVYASLKEAQSYCQAINSYQARLPDMALRTTFYIEQLTPDKEWIERKKGKSS